MSIINALGALGFVNETANAVVRWKTYHDTSNFANTLVGEDKLILESCLEDEYNEMVENELVMGIGLVAYNNFRRRFK